MQNFHSLTLADNDVNPRRLKSLMACCMRFVVAGIEVVVVVVVVVVALDVHEDIADFFLKVGLTS